VVVMWCLAGFYGPRPVDFGQRARGGIREADLVLPAAGRRERDLSNAFPRRFRGLFEQVAERCTSECDSYIVAWLRSLSAPSNAMRTAPALRSVTAEGLPGRARTARERSRRLEPYAVSAPPATPAKVKEKMCAATSAGTLPEPFGVST